MSTMHNIDDMMEFLEQEEGGIDIKEFLFKLLNKWYWFVLFGFLGFAGGYIASKFQQPSYQVNSTLLITEQTQKAGLDNLLDGFNMGSKTNVHNHIVILNSYELNNQALKELNWRTNWYKKGFFKDSDLFGQHPFEVKEVFGKENIGGFPITITPLSENKFLISADGIYEKDGIEYEINFEKELQYGELFENKFFAFSLSPKETFEFEEGDEFNFRFNDLAGQTKNYKENLSVGLLDKKADLIRVQLEGNVPARDVAYINKLNEKFIEFGMKQKNLTSENTVRFIDAQITNVVDSLNIAGENFTNFRSKNRVMDMGQEAGLVIQKLEELESEQAMSKMRLEYYRNLRDYMGDATKMKKMATPSVVGITDMGLNVLVGKLIELYSKYEILSYTVQDKNPSLILLNKEINHTRSSLTDMLSNLLDNAEVETKSLNKRLQKINSQLSDLPQTEQEMIEIKRNFDLNNELYTFLLEKRAEAAITKASNVPDAQVLDEARIETAEKVGPKTLINVVIGFILGLGIPFAFIIISDFFNDTIKSKEEIEKESKLPMMGTIVHNNYKKELPLLDHPRSAISESFRAIRTNLQYFLTEDDQKVIGVHSTIPGEGKSFVSTNLAAIIAMNNKKVLLVGADLRKPRLNTIFKTSSSSGLSTYLINKNSFEEVVSSTHIKNLSIVHAGAVPPNPAEILENRAEEFVKEARKHFDYIIIDNAPLSLVTDGILIGRHADANLIIMRQGHSHKDQIKFVNKVADQGNLPKVGIVLNGVKNNGFGAGNTYGSDGSGYYDDDHGKSKKLLSVFSKN